MYPINFSSLRSALHAASTWSCQPRKILLCLGICLHSYHSSSSCMTPHMCGYVLDDCILCSLCERAWVPFLAEKEWDSSPVNLALLSFPQPLYMCSYIPFLIENRVLPKSWLTKELLFPFCVYSHGYVCPKNTSYPWVFPLNLSFRLVPYRKLITDWLGSCIPLISHGSAWGSVWEIDGDRTKNNKHVVQ